MRCLKLSFKFLEIKLLRSDHAPATKRNNLRKALLSFNTYFAFSGFACFNTALQYYRSSWRDKFGYLISFKQ